MEVHHHAHHDHGKKNWKSYFWEFIMLFLAVFCGFLAEYALEHKIEADREKQFMESLTEDLSRDTSKINSIYQFALHQKTLCDSLINLIYYQPLSGTNIEKLYMLHFSTNRVIGVNFEDRTATQLKNAGGMRLLRNKIVVDSILSYWNRVETMDFIKERLSDGGNEITKLSVRIFHTKYITPGDLPLDPPKGIIGGAYLVDNDPKLITEYVNRQYIKNSRLTNYIFNLLQTKERAIRLMETIRNRYHLK